MRTLPIAALCCPIGVEQHPGAKPHRKDDDHDDHFAMFVKQRTSSFAACVTKTMSTEHRYFAKLVDLCVNTPNALLVSRES